MSAIIGWTLLLQCVSAFDFGDLFEQAFGGGGGFHYQFNGGGFGGRQQLPRGARFPSHVRNEIDDAFGWLKGTEWNFGGYARCFYLNHAIGMLQSSVWTGHFCLDVNVLIRRCVFGLRTMQKYSL